MSEEPLHNPQDKLFKAGFETKLRQIQEPETRADAMTLAQQYHNEGLQKELQESVIETLDIRFEQVPEGLIEEVNGIHDETHLRRLHRAAVICASLEEFAAELCSRHWPRIRSKQGLQSVKRHPKSCNVMRLGHDCGTCRVLYLC